MQNNEQVKVVKLFFVGRDSWNRPVYVQTNNPTRRPLKGTYWVDVDPLKDCAPRLHTKVGNQFDGEPNNPMREDVQVEFIPARDVW